MIRLYASPIVDSSAKGQSKCAYELLFSALRRDFGIDTSLSDISKTQLGKPYFAQGNAKGIFFSISHTSSLAVCAISDEDVGVDAERSDREVSERIRKRWLCDCDADESLSAWTALESKGKLIGCGVSNSAMLEEDISVKHYTLSSNGVEYTVALASRKHPEKFPDKIEVIL